MRRWWLAYGAGAALVVAALATVSRDVLDLERSERAARRDTLHHERVRLALWRMDSWLAPRLTSESARPFFEYYAAYSRERPYGSLQLGEDGSTLDGGEWSPLLTWDSPDLPLHFRVDGVGRFASPQVPTGPDREQALLVCLAEPIAESKEALLHELAASLSAETLADAVADSQMQQEFLALEAERPQAPARDGSRWVASAQTALNNVEFAKRAQTVADTNRNYLPPVSGALQVGPFVPVWYGPDQDRLLYARRVSLGDAVEHQGFLVDWPRLAEHLTGEVSDLIRGARLEPLVGGPADEQDAGLVLAGVPARLHAEPLPDVALLGAEEGLSPVRLALLLSWAAVLAALVGVGLTLRSAVVLGERRVRFASAVTHELRTPLTTFRLYSEMLADDMVADPAQRAEYLATLRDESNRLARLVENVLAYARLEEGRSPVQLEHTTVGGLLQRVAPALRRRADDGAMQLVVADEELAEATVTTDVTVVGQVLFNLVDNAVKYAARGAIRVEPSLDDERLVLSVRDEGPGVPRHALRSVFQPFERSAPEATPGVGLGLSLSRGLARELGGDLQLDGEAGPGACFRLVLPRGA